MPRSSLALSSLTVRPARFGAGPLIKHYFEADADTGAYCTPDGKLKGLDSLVDMAGGLAQNLTLEMIDWGVGTVNKIGTLRPAMSKHIVDLRDITAKVRESTGVRLVPLTCFQKPSSLS